MTLFQNRFKQLKDSSGVSSYKIYTAIGSAPSTVTNWLEGKSVPDMNYLIKLADYFNVSIDYLVGRSDKP